MSDSLVFILFELTLHGQKQVRAVTQTSWSGELRFYALHFDIMRSTNKVICRYLLQFQSYAPDRVQRVKSFNERWAI